MKLITPTLLNNFHFYSNYCGENQAEKRQEFLDMLAKVRREPNEAMQKGIDFEEQVHAYTAYPNDKDYSPAVQEAGSIVRGGIWQEKVRKKMGDYLLYGRPDVIKVDTIYDIKRAARASNYDIGKYEHSAQHKIYMYCTHIPNFEYVISDGKDVWREQYTWNDRMLDSLREKIYEMECYLKQDKAAGKLYKQHWGAHSE